MSSPPIPHSPETAIPPRVKASIIPAKFAGALLIFFAAICFSAKAIMVKLAFRYHVDPLSLLFLRMVFALPFFVLIPLWRNKHKPSVPPTTTDWLKVVMLGVLGYYLSSLLDFSGLQYITAGLERLILFIYPTLVVLISVLFLKKPLRKREVWALLLTYAGIGLVFFNDDLLHQKDAGLGAVLIFGSALTYAIYLVGSGRLIPRFGSVHFTAYVMITSCLSVIVHYVWVCFTTHHVSIMTFPQPVYALGLAVAIFSTVIPTFMVSKGIQMIGANRASIIASIGPVATIILGFFILGETVSGSEIFGTILVLAGVLLVSAHKEPEAK